MPPSTIHAAIGQRVSYNGTIGTIRYVGKLEGQGEKIWLGIEWDDETRGKGNGSLNGKIYFKCLSPSTKAASFIAKDGRNPDPALSFLEALRLKYASDVPLQPNPSSDKTQIIISGKVAEEVGFDKIRQQQSRLDELKFVVLADHRLGFVSKPGEEAISAVCPAVEVLDLSRNLLGSFSDVVGICSELRSLKTLRMNENRFSDLESSEGVQVSQVEQYNQSLALVTEVEMQKVLLAWEGLERAMSYFASLMSFDASRNNLMSIERCSRSFDSLKTLVLEENNFKSLSDLRQLSHISSLEVLRLKRNRIATIRTEQDSAELIRPFSKKLRYIDLSSNQINDWNFIDKLPTVFPGITELRISDNPIHKPIPVNIGMKAEADDSFLHAIALLANLEILNFSKVSPTDRMNAELFYLSNVGKALANATDQNQTRTILAENSRYQELCEKHDKPMFNTVNPAAAVNPHYLEASLIACDFYLPPNSQPDQQEKISLQKDIPKSSDIYRVKGLVGKTLGIPPWKVRLIWETGEWDPVAEYGDEGKAYDEDDDDTGGEDEELAGRLVSREVELVSSTRPLSNWVDGMKATIRVEVME